MTTDTTRRPLAPLPAQPGFDVPLTAFERSRVKLIWVLLVMSSLPWGLPTRVIAIPKRFEQLGTAIALGLAALLALAINRRLRVRDGGFIGLYLLLAAVALVPVLGGWAGLGSLFRTGRFVLALLLVLLLSPYWQRDRDVLLEAHLDVYKVLLIVTGLGLVTGMGFNPLGRLWTQIPAMEPPQLGQVAGMTAGICLLLLVGRVVPARRAAVWTFVSLTFLMLSYTRTAMLALLVGLLLAMLSMLSTSRRARAMLSVLFLALPLIVLLAGPLADTWFRRGQDEAMFSTLTGRTRAWDLVYAFPRDTRTDLFGIGLTDKSIEGLSIDSGFLAVYHEEGRIGVAVVVFLLVALVGTTVFAPPGPRRSIALFLVTYCIMASYTETGIGDMSSYILSLIVAASLVWGSHFKTPRPMTLKL